VCSCHLEEPLGKSQPTISHHTRVLAQAGLIEGDKRGKWTWWRIVPERLASVRALPECGHKVPETFCDVCGYDLVEQTRDKALRFR
jgi:hypothetical protein